LAPPAVLIVSPYAAAANNGNVRTAQRWSKLLQPQYKVTISTSSSEVTDADVLIALHARRSHDYMRSWMALHPSRPVVLTLTGTDLYGDVPRQDRDAIASLEAANRLVVLQERGIAALPARFRTKANVIFQSAPAIPAYPKANRRIRVVFVGHLREEKDPCTFVRAAARLIEFKDIEFSIIGGMRDATLERPFRQALTAAPNVRMLGSLSYPATRERIRRAHLLVVPSRMEGGANVIGEAITSGTVVLASDCDGNLGMLGADYPGVFKVGDHLALAHLIARCRSEAVFYDHLAQRCQARATLFAPATERQRLLDVLESVIVDR